MRLIITLILILTVESHENLKVGNMYNEASIKMKHSAFPLAFRDMLQSPDGKKLCEHRDKSHS